MLNTRARFLITEPDILPKIALTTEICDLPASNVFMIGESESDIPLCYKSWGQLLEHGETDWITFQDDDEARNTTAALLSTSGTTGLPKAAMISHYSCVMQNVMLEDSKQKPYKVSPYDHNKHSSFS